MFKTVLFAIDQSREAHEAAVIVTNLVKTYGSSLYVLAVVEPDAEVVEAPVVEVVKPKGLTETWKFKVVDESAIPRELLILDEKKVKDWLKTNKDKLSNGLVVGGIEFYIEESIRLR